MKKILILMMMVLLVPVFLSAHSVEDVTLYDGCVLLWRPDVVKATPELDIPAYIIELFCGNIPIAWVHVDWCMDAQEKKIVTATPNKGTVDYSTLENRWESDTWNKCAVLVNPDLDFDASKERMKEIEDLPYDWFGYYLHIGDLLSCSKKTFFRDLREPLLRLFGINEAYHCASQTFYIVDYQQPHITTPPDFYNDAINEAMDNGWIVDAVYDVEVTEEED